MDVRDLPNWAPLTGLHQAGDWCVRSWCEPLLPGLPCGDAVIVALHTNEIRLAVLDTVSPAHRGLKQASRWAQDALRIVSGHLTVNTDLRICLASAWEDLHQSRSHSLDGPQCCVAAVDLPLGKARDQQEQATAYVAGDCDVWVKRDGSWERLSTRQAIRAGSARAWTDRPSAAKDPVGHWRSKLEALPSEEDWDFPPMGVGASPRLQTLDVSACQEIVLASDGPRLAQSTMTDLAGWLRGGLQIAPAGWEHRSAHGDVAVVHAAQTPMPRW